MRKQTALALLCCMAISASHAQQTYTATVSGSGVNFVSEIYHQYTEPKLKSDLPALHHLVIQFATGISDSARIGFEAHRKLNLGHCYLGLGECEKAYACFAGFTLNKSAGVDMGFYLYEGKKEEQSYKKAYELWSDSTSALPPILRAIVMYATKDQKLFGKRSIRPGCIPGKRRPWQK
jgi:hypothetical protein